MQRTDGRKGSLGCVLGAGSIRDPREVEEGEEPGRKCEGDRPQTPLDSASQSSDENPCRGRCPMPRSRLRRSRASPADLLGRIGFVAQKSACGNRSCPMPCSAKGVPSRVFKRPRFALRAVLPHHLLRPLDRDPTEPSPPVLSPPEPLKSAGAGANSWAPPTVSAPRAAGGRPGGGDITGGPCKNPGGGGMPPKNPAKTPGGGIDASIGDGVGLNSAAHPEVDRRVARKRRQVRRERVSRPPSAPLSPREARALFVSLPLPLSGPRLRKPLSGATLRLTLQEPNPALATTSTRGGRRGAPSGARGGRRGGMPPRPKAPGGPKTKGAGAVIGAGAGRKLRCRCRCLRPWLRRRLRRTRGAGAARPPNGGASTVNCRHDN